MQQIFRVNMEKVKMFEIDSRVGLNGSTTNWHFSCMQDEERKNFIVWLGDVNIDKFTKSTFMNLVHFAEKAGCTQMILV